MLNVIIAVPGRLESKRLPGKLLENIGESPMFIHVLNRCAQAIGRSNVVFCSDSEELISIAVEHEYQAVISPRDCNSGTDRISRVIPSFISGTYNDLIPQQTLVLNVQADQPFIDPEIILSLINRFEELGRPEVITPIYRLSREEIQDPNIVKVVTSVNDRALYFSRSSIPFNRDLPEEDWASETEYWGHVGIYGFRLDVLTSWPSLPKSILEEIEHLEQLRFLEAGGEIAVMRTTKQCSSIDTFGQLEEARTSYHQLSH